MSKKSRKKEKGKGRPGPASSGFGIAGLKLRDAVFLGVLVILFYPPYFRGLFFPREQLITHIYTTVLFALWWTYKLRRGDGTFLRGPMDYAALGLVGSYILSTFVAVNIRGAIGEDLKYINYFMLYWLVSELVRDAAARAPAGEGPEAGYQVARILLNVMLASAVGVAVLGIGVAAGTFHYNGALVDGRISSSIQYPNSLAAHLTAAFFIGLGLWLNEPRTLKRLVYVAACYLLLLTFIFTYSRGAWLVFPVAFGLLLVALPRGFRLLAALFLVAVLVPLVAAVPFFARGLSNRISVLVWGVTLAGMPVAAAASAVAGWFVAQPLRRKVAVAAALLSLFLIGGGVAVGILLRQPLVLAHRPGEGDIFKYYDQKVDVKPGTSYELKAEVKASGGKDKPFAWAISVFTPARGGSPEKTLLYLQGKDTGGWSEQKGKLETPADAREVTVRLISNYAGTTSSFRNISLSETNNPASTRTLTFTASRLVAQGQLQRLSIGLSEYSAWSRLRWAADALKIVKDRPLLGGGGRAWSSLYFRYQSYGYWSTEVHNHFLQTWVETGTVGFMAFLALWATFLAAFWRGLRQGPSEKKALTITVPVGALALGLHSFIDFNLSLSAISFYLWTLWGLTNTPFSGPIVGERYDRGAVSWWSAAAGYAVAGALIAAALTLLAGFNYGQQGATFLAQKDPEKARLAFEKARVYDPFTASFRIDLAQIYEAIGNQQKDASLVSRAWKELEEGIRLEPYNPGFQAFKGVFSLRHGRVEEGLASLERAVELQPFQEKHYANLAQAYLLVGTSNLQKKNQDQARDYLQKAVSVRDRLVEIVSRIPVEVPPHQRTNADYPPLALTAGQAMVLLQEWNRAEELLKVASNSEETPKQAWLWLGVLYERKGEQTLARQYLEKAWSADPSLKSEYQRVTSLFQ